MGKFNKVAESIHILAQFLESGWSSDFDTTKAHETAIKETTPVVRFLRTSPDAQIPTRGTDDAVGYDVRSTQNYILRPGARVLIDTGWKIAVQDGFEVQVRPRSGLALKKGITVLNTPGTIDPDYRGGLGVILINLSEEPFEINVGDRIAQLVVAPVTSANMVEVDAFDDATKRGEGGYGSTGVKG
jgi:dUTP pyrophosphatase